MTVEQSPVQIHPQAVVDPKAQLAAGPITTWDPTTAPGPITTPAASSAFGSTTAVE